jgi:uncharacterized protein YdeI (YjbR/CyaY-like superfamily)
MKNKELQSSMSLKYIKEVAMSNIKGNGEWKDIEASHTPEEVQRALDFYAKSKDAHKRYQDKRNLILKKAIALGLDKQV